MNHGTENDRQQCAARPWCDEPGPEHEGAHSGEVDLPKITATGYREDFSALDDGIAVPEVIARLEEHVHSNAFDRHVVNLSIVRPDETHANCYLTIKEAELLGKALSQLRDLVQDARSRGAA